ncbi:potassium-transporting ATPase subunit F [Paucibacter sp. JuS9]
MNSLAVLYWACGLATGGLFVYLVVALWRAEEL